MKTLYRFLILLTLLLVAHATVRAQDKPKVPARTVTGLGDPEPAMPRNFTASLFATTETDATPTNDKKSAPVSEEATLAKPSVTPVNSTVPAGN